MDIHILGKEMHMICGWIWTNHLTIWADLACQWWLSGHWLSFPRWLELSPVVNHAPRWSQHFEVAWDAGCWLISDAQSGFRRNGSPGEPIDAEKSKLLMKGLREVCSSNKSWKAMNSCSQALSLDTWTLGRSGPTKWWVYRWNPAKPGEAEVVYIQGGQCSNQQWLGWC